MLKYNGKSLPPQYTIRTRSDQKSFNQMHISHNIVDVVVVVVLVVEGNRN